MGSYLNHLDYLNATSPKLTATQKLQQNSAQQDNNNSKSGVDINGKQQMPKLNLGTNKNGSHVNLQLSLDENADDLAAMDDFFAESGDGLTNLDDFFGEKADIIKPTPSSADKTNNVNEAEKMDEYNYSEYGDPSNLKERNPFVYDEENIDEFSVVANSNTVVAAYEEEIKEGLASSDHDVNDNN